MASGLPQTLTHWPTRPFEAAAGDYAVDREGAQGVLFQPWCDREIGCRIERDNIDGLPVGHDRNDALGRDPGDPRDGSQGLYQAGLQSLVGRLHCEEARGDVDEGAARHDDKIGTHS